MNAKLLVLAICAPLALVLDHFEQSPTVVFVLAATAIVPLSSYLEEATEALSHYLGPTVGSLLNSTLGNLPELIISLAALSKGLDVIVKASIAGSILGCLLLSLGLAMIAGGIGRVQQHFNSVSAGLNSALLFLAVVALMVPWVFHITTSEKSRGVSVEMAIVLLAVYAAGLVFSLITHHQILGRPQTHGDEEPPTLGKAQAFGLLVGAAVVLAFLSEALTGSIEPATTMLGLSDIFAGMFLLAGVGNLAQIINAVRFARKDNMDLALGVTLQASMQMALLVAPLLVLLDLFIGDGKMNLIFTSFEAFALLIAVQGIRNLIPDGESNWIEGVMLVAIYVLLGIGVFYLPE